MVELLSKLLLLPSITKVFIIIINSQHVMAWQNSHKTGKFSLFQKWLICTELGKKKYELYRNKIFKYIINTTEFWNIKQKLRFNHGL